MILAGYAAVVGYPNPAGIVSKRKYPENLRWGLSVIPDLVIEYRY